MRLAGRAVTVVVASVGVTALVLVTTSAFGSDANEDAQLWAEMLQHTRDRAAADPFSGVMEVEWRDESGVHRQQIEVSGAGDIVQVSLGSDVVSSTTDRVVVAGRAMTIDTGSAPLPALAEGKYDIRRRPGMAVAGRSTTRFDAVLRSHDVVVARVYVDDESGVVLRRETFDEHGDALRRVWFTRIDDERSASKMTVPPASNEPDAKHDLDPPYRGPSRAGAGFRRIGRWAHDDGLVQLYYSDGLMGVSVFEQPGRLSWSQLPAAQGSASIEGHEARRYALPVGETWVFERGGIVYTVVGDVPPRELVAVAADVSAPDEPLITRVARVALSPFRW